ncbi:MAG TPA: hypothetical protein VGH42_12335 [Verrucomicrobiae bacterium]|jgi:hypothetical protein
MMLAKIKSGETGVRRFEFERDSFAFPNELLWEYQFDAATRKTIFRKREPPPDYAHRCFVLTRAARQFLYHARFDAGQEVANEEIYRQLIRKVISRNPRTPCEPETQIIIPGFASLREFSAAREKLLKSECGGAWRSYVLRSHWRMVFPISRAHQNHTAENLSAAIRKKLSPIVHLVKFPSLTINHGMILFDVAGIEDGLEFSAYDPNDPEKPARLKFDRAAGTFFLPENSYWAGGELNVIEIYHGWFL